MGRMLSATIKLYLMLIPPRHCNTFQAFSAGLPNRSHRRLLGAYCASIVLGVFIFAHTAVGQQRIQHPTAENIPDPDTLAHFITEADTVSTDPDMEALAQRLRAAVPIDTIGALEGPRHYMLGEIVDAGLNSRGELFVLDSEHRELFVYTSTGDYIMTIGRPGDGPGEFAYPEDLYIDVQDRIYVADRRSRISVLTPTTASYTFSHLIALNFSPASICAVDDAVFVAGPMAGRDSNPIHAFAASDGQYLSSLGQPYRTTSATVRQQLSEGKLSCPIGSSKLLYMYDVFPIIYGFEASGDFAWASSLDDYQGFEIVETVIDGEPWIMSRPREGRFDRLEAIIPTQGSSAIVQILRVSIDQASESRTAQRKTYLVHAESGKGMHLGWQFPRIHAMNDTLLVASTLDDFPAIVLYQY